MKAKTAALALCALLFLSGQGIAAQRDFQHFSIDLPAGWNVESEGNTTAFIFADKSATLQVTVESITRVTGEGITARELAEIYAQELHGSAPAMTDNDPNYYSFTFRAPEGLESEASVVVSGNIFYLITISGRHKDLARMVESVLLSIP